jgi:nitrite reductase/ring-hydroxylating ferredoxin subunit
MQYLNLGPASAFDSPEMRVVTLIGKQVGIWRAGDGEWHAMEMICRHQNGDLTHGRRDGDIVTCPRHGWQYDLSTGRCLTRPWASLRRYTVREEHGELKISMFPTEGRE